MSFLFSLISLSLLQVRSQNDVAQPFRLFLLHTVKYSLYIFTMYISLYTVHICMYVYIYIYILYIPLIARSSRTLKILLFLLLLLVRLGSSDQI